MGFGLQAQKTKFIYLSPRSRNPIQTLHVFTPWAPTIEITVSIKKHAARVGPLFWKSAKPDAGSRSDALWDANALKSGPVTPRIQALHYNK